ncbi:unnamed protein product [Lupinus luteus]|uniref:WLM domain-containing protein n=1 Tax=Lupinus luteus TaxID=3873 RepID=A0AAV1XFK7_LUPLU
METPQSLLKISVTWRGKKFIVEMDLGANLKELGQELHKLTNIQEDTMRFIVPSISGKASKLLAPFSTEHAHLSLQETSITEAKSIKMMGVSTDEVEEVLQNAKANLRIAGFEEEEMRQKQRVSHGPGFSLKLPKGPYIFCEFRTLEIPGIKLNPPPFEALKRMHMLAADPGIVAVMNKHRWRVGIMTEMPPIGYVGVSPKCLLGFNKNQGEEISLRLRTDDLKGFRKYQSIKKTLLHELAHMIYSDHDANFYALDKQLNQEAASLDWTRSASHTLSEIRSSRISEEDFIAESSNIPQKLGGNRTDWLTSARESSVAAAYHRIVHVSADKPGESEINQEPDPCYTSETPDRMTPDSNAIIDIGMPILVEKGYNSEPDPDDHYVNGMKQEPDPDDSHHETLASNVNMTSLYKSKEPDPEDSDTYLKPVDSTVSNFSTENLSRMDIHKPDTGDLEAEKNNFKHGSEPDPDKCEESSTMQTDEPDPDDEEFQRINDPVTAVYNRLQNALELLRGDTSSMQTASSLQTLLKIIRNVIEHPEETKYKRLRKANPVIQNNILNNKAALEILLLVGFSEDTVLDNLGKAEAYLVLKRNDPGLLWLAKSTLESCRA